MLILSINELRHRCFTEIWEIQITFIILWTIWGHSADGCSEGLCSDRHKLCSAGRHYYITLCASLISPCREAAPKKKRAFFKKWAFFFLGKNEFYCQMCKINSQNNIQMLRNRAGLIFLIPGGGRGTSAEISCTGWTYAENKVEQIYGWG